MIVQIRPTLPVMMATGAALLLSGCFGDNTSSSPLTPDKPVDPVEVTLTDIRFAKDEHTLLLDESRSLVSVPEQMIAVYSDGAEKTFAEAGIDAASLQWTADNGGVFAYDETAHTITALTEGSVMIGATYDGKSTQTKLNVIDEFKALQLDADAGKLLVGGAPVNVSAFATGIRGQRTPVGSETGVRFTPSSNAEWDDKTMTLKATEAGAVTLQATYTPIRDGVEGEPVLSNTLSLTADAAPILDPAGSGSVNIVSPGMSSVIAGTQVQLDVILVDDEGKVITDVSLVTWAVCDSAYPEVGGEAWECKPSAIATVSDDGLVTFVAGQSGSVTISASFSGKSSYVTFTVDAPALTSVATTKSSFEAMLPGQSIHLTTYASYDSGRSEDVSSAATYLVAPEGIVAVDGNKVTALAAGTATITPSFGGVVGNPVSVDVSAVSATALTASAVGNIASGFIVGDTGAVTVMAQMNDGTIRDITDVVNWKASTPGVDDAIVTLSGSTAKALSAGTATWLASYGDLSASLSFNVIEPALQYIDFKTNGRFDNTHTLLKGESIAFAVIATYESGKQTTLKPADMTLSWAADAETPGAKVLTSTNDEGELLVVFGAAGKGTLTANYKGQETAITITLEDDERSLSGLVINATASRVYVGKTLQFNAASIYTDNSSQPLNASQVIWTVNNPEVAIISNDGVLTALTKGSVTVTANYSDYRSQEVLIDVDDAVVESISLGPVYISSSRGDTGITELDLIPNELVDISFVYAHMSNGASEEVPFEDVMVFDAKGIMQTFHGINGNSTFIYPRVPGNTSLTLSYGGQSLNVPVIVEDVVYSELFLSCGGGNVEQRSSDDDANASFINIDRYMYGVCTLIARVNEQNHLLAAAGGVEVDGGLNAVSVQDNTFTGVRGFGIFAKSGMDVNVNDTINFKACLFDGRCASRSLEVVDRNDEFNFGYSGSCSSFGGKTLYTKLGATLNKPARILYQGRCTNDYDRTSVITPSTIGYSMDNMPVFNFTPLSVGEAEVTLTARVNNDIDLSSSTTFTIKVVEGGDYHVNNSATIEINAGESSWVLPPLIYDKWDAELIDITSTVIFESQDPEFIIADGELQFTGGNTLPESVTLNVVSAASPNKDVVDSIKAVTINFVDVSSMGDKELNACSETDRWNCIVTRVGPDGSEYAFLLDNYAGPFLKNYLDKLSKDGTDISEVRYSLLFPAFIEQGGIYSGLHVNVEGAKAVCSMLNERGFKGRTNWEFAPRNALNADLNNTISTLGTDLVSYHNSSLRKPMLLGAARPDNGYAPPSHWTRYSGSQWAVNYSGSIYSMYHATCKSSI